MKKNAALICTRILYVMTGIGTIISLFIVYKDIDSIFAIRFLVGFLYFVLFILIYISFITVINSRKLKCIKIKKRLLRFIAMFILLGKINFNA